MVDKGTHMLIINDDNWKDQIGNGTYLPETDPNAGGVSRYFGTLPRQIEYCASPELSEVAEPMIPRTEWDARIEEAIATKSRLSDAFKLYNQPVLNQSSTNYCHSNSPVSALMLLRAISGQSFVSLSPGSVAGPITNYQNRGATIDSALKQITQHGAASTDFVPANQISKSGWKPGAVENAKLHRVTEWYDLGYRERGDDMFLKAASLVLARIPVCVGYNWWGHAVTLLDLVRIERGVYGFLFLNSWGTTYGQGGFAVLQEGKGTPDAAYAPRAVSMAA